MQFFGADYASSPGLLTGVTGYVAVDHTLALTVLAFRGSHSFRNWAADLDFALIPTDICPLCLCHQGLYVLSYFPQSRLELFCSLLFSPRLIAYNLPQKEEAERYLP